MATLWGFESLPGHHLHIRSRSEDRRPAPVFLGAERALRSSLPVPAIRCRQLYSIRSFSELPSRGDRADRVRENFVHRVVAAQQARDARHVIEPSARHPPSSFPSAREYSRCPQPRIRRSRGACRNRAPPAPRDRCPPRAGSRLSGPHSRACCGSGPRPSARGRRTRARAIPASASPRSRRQTPNRRSRAPAVP